MGKIVCSFTIYFCSKQTLFFQLHIERLPDVQKPAACPRCDPSLTFSNRFELNSHFLSTHAQSDTKFPCGQCLEMVTKGLINQHIQRKHVSVIIQRRFSCLTLFEKNQSTYHLNCTKIPQMLHFIDPVSLSEMDYMVLKTY